MSRSLGNRLPPELVQRLSAAQPELTGHAVVIATTDEGAAVEDVRADEPDASREDESHIVSGITFRTAPPEVRRRTVETMWAGLRGSGA